MELRNGDLGRCRRKILKRGEISYFYKDFDSKLVAVR